MIGADDHTIGDRVSAEYDHLKGAKPKQHPSSVAGTVCFWVLILATCIAIGTVATHAALRIVELFWRLS